MLRSALLLLSGNAAGSILSFARNLVVARLLSVADYGIASTFAVALAVIEMLSALGVQTHIVQSRQGDDPRFQAALQGFQVLRGVANGLVLLALAAPLAGFLRIPEAAWGYQVVAIVPVLGALAHLDMARLGRQMNFGPGLVAGVVPAAVSLAAVWPLWRLLGDWRVMLWSIVIQAATGMVMSHLLAHRPYRLAFDRRQMAESFRFGWPILVNGGLMFVAFNGDKLVVGRALGMEALAIFAMGFTLTLTPALIVARSVSNLVLPPLSRQARDGAGDEARFQRMAAAAMEVHFVAGMFLIVVTCLVGPWFVQAVLGDRYGGLAPLLPWLAVLQAVRMMKSGPGIVAMARGHTANALIANVSRAASIPVAWLALELGGGLVAVLIIAIVGEVLGLAVALLLLRGRQGFALRRLWPTALVMAPFWAATAAYGAADGLGATLGAPASAVAATAMVVMSALALAAVAASSGLVRQLFGAGRWG